MSDSMPVFSAMQSRIRHAPALSLDAASTLGDFSEPMSSDGLKAVVV